MFKDLFKKNPYRDVIDKVIVTGGKFREILSCTKDDCSVFTSFTIQDVMLSRYSGNKLCDEPTKANIYYGAIHTKIPLEYIGRDVDFVSTLLCGSDGLMHAVEEELFLMDKRVSADVPKKLYALTKYIEKHY